MRPIAASAIVVALLSALVASAASARSSDRDQPMDINADNIDALLEDDSVSVLRGNVRIRQGSLEVDADQADIHRKGGEIDRIVLTGSPARLRQVSDTGEPMDASAREVVYTMSSEIMLLNGGVVVKQARGDLRGERIKYDIATGRLDGGGDGNRVSLRIMPKTAPKN